MKLLPLTSLVISPSRQRAEFDPQALQELADSIEKFGLMQPIVVRNGQTLVAGERRLRAIAQIRELGGQIHFHDTLVPDEVIPVVDLGELSPLEAEEAELDENTKRKDLTWQELAAATDRLHRLRLAQTKGGQTVADTAREITGRDDGYYAESTRQKIIVAKHLDDPAVAGAKTLNDAFKILKRQDEAKSNVALALSVGASYSASSHSLILGDCIGWMQSADKEQFDVILTDPPYGMDADSFGDAAGRLSGITHAYDDTPESFEELIRHAAEGIARVAKPSAHLYLCCDIDQFHFLRALFGREQYGGWKVFRTPLINYKLSSGRVPLPEFGPRRCYETILYAYRGDKRTTAIYPDVISTAGDENLGHGAQKPVALYDNLLTRSTRPGDRVLDPFAGTGTIFPACHARKLYATGIEREPSYYGIAVKRLESLDGPA